jgi:hypothetical protein
MRRSSGLRFLSGTTVLVDVAGSVGSALCSILRATPGCAASCSTCRMSAPARAYIAAQGLADRCEFAGGSFFDSAAWRWRSMKHIFMLGRRRMCEDSPVLQNTGRERGCDLRRIVPASNTSLLAMIDYTR